MSAQTMADVFAPVEARNYEIVCQNTWGHLAPRRNKTYRGSLVFAVGAFGNDPLNPTLLTMDFGDLDSSPWLFDAMEEFARAQKGEPGAVYRFDGTFRNYQFKGVVRRLTLVMTEDVSHAGPA